ncbi:MAG: hypothetical protein EBV15_01225 [Bacteroidetes bacterium]|nr:hypothetical protein [Bacteroidota bacterium]
MKNITKLFFMGATTLMMATSCKKEDDKNTTPTPSANAGLTSCSVNGKAWTSGKTGTYTGLDSFPGCEAYMSGDTMTFVSTNFSDTSVVLAQLTLTPGRTGTYTGTTSTEGGMFYLPKFDETSLFQAFLMYTTSYTFTITKWDNTTKKFSGTFNFNMVSNTGGSGFNITNGKFEDVKYFIN